MTDAIRQTRLQQITAREQSATKVGLKRIRYEHGGGRMYGEDRTLAVDCYNERDREFYFAAIDDIPWLLSEVERLEQEKAELQLRWQNRSDTLIQAEAENARLRAALTTLRDELQRGADIARSLGRNRSAADAELLDDWSKIARSALAPGSEP